MSQITSGLKLLLDLQKQIHFSSDFIYPKPKQVDITAKI